MKNWGLKTKEWLEPEVELETAGPAGSEGALAHGQGGTSAKAGILSGENSRPVPFISSQNNRHPKLHKIRIDKNEHLKNKNQLVVAEIKYSIASIKLRKALKNKKGIS